MLQFCLSQIHQWWRRIEICHERGENWGLLWRCWRCEVVTNLSSYRHPQLDPYKSVISDKGSLLVRLCWQVWCKVCFCSNDWQGGTWCKLRFFLRRPTSSRALCGATEICPAKSPHSLQFLAISLLFYLLFHSTMFHVLFEGIVQEPKHICC